VGLDVLELLLAADLQLKRGLEVVPLARRREVDDEGLELDEGTEGALFLLALLFFLVALLVECAAGSASPPIKNR
jgi:hypothetical protein